MFDSSDGRLGCGHCHMHGSCPLNTPEGQSGDSPAELKGMVGFATAVFLIPLGMGIGGAYTAAYLGGTEATSSPSHWHMIGLGLGLAIGVVLARLYVSLRRPKKPACPAGGDQ